MLNTIEELERQFSSEIEFIRRANSAKIQIQEKIKEAFAAFDAKIEEAKQISEETGVPFDFEIEEQVRMTFTPTTYSNLIKKFDEEKGCYNEDESYRLERILDKLDIPIGYYEGWTSSQIC